MSEWTPRRDGPWVALDVGLARHRKVEGLSAPAFRLYIVCLCHCGDELTDGAIRPSSVRRLLAEAGTTMRHARELEDAELLKPDKAGGYTVPGYLDWNPSRAWWERRREYERTRKADYRRRQRGEQEPKLEPSFDQTYAVSSTKANPKSETEYEQAERHKQRDGASLSPRDNPRDVPQGTPPTNETRSTKSSSPKGTDSRENDHESTAPSLLVESLRLELERLTGPDGVPV